MAKTWSLLGCFSIGRHKIVERILQRQIHTLISLNKMQFGFMPGKEIADGIFIVWKMQENYQKKNNKLYMCFVDMEKAFNRVPRRSRP